MKTVKKDRWTLKIGDEFTCLKIESREPSAKGHTRWGCRCSGEECEGKGYIVVYDRNLKEGNTTRCDKCSRPDNYTKIHMRRQKKSPKLLPLGRILPGQEIDGVCLNDSGRKKWVCLLNGRFVGITETDLLTGRREQKIGTKPKPTNARNPAYLRTRQCWRDMKRRCDDPKHEYSHRYGGRGIRYDELWKEFAVFLYQMGEMPEGLTLHRINHNDHYHRANCKWATDEEQNAPGARRSRNSEEEEEIIPFLGAYAEGPDPRLSYVYVDNGITI